MSAVLLQDKTFEYTSARVKDFAVRTEVTEEPTDARSRRLRKLKGVQSITIGDRKLEPTKRFWTSLQCRFGFSSNIFRYFSHAEVFNRVSEVAPDDMIRFCIEKDASTGKELLLAVTNPNAACVRFDNLQNLLGKYGTEGITYANGIVRSTHKPKVGNNSYKILGDDFNNQYVIDTPIDGFGKPSIYLSMLRLVCSNGAVGYGKAFRSELNTGSRDDDVTFAIMRAIDGYNNEDGFAAMRQRFAAAGKSWASVNEAQKLYKLLMSIGGQGSLKKIGRELVQTTNGVESVESALPIFTNFHNLTGDISQVYGLANLDALSAKRQRMLPVACKVYDLLNFASEVATHYTNSAGGRKIQAFIGDIIGSEYDLEGTCDQFGSWQEFLITDDGAAEAREAARKAGSGR